MRRLTPLLLILAVSACSSKTIMVPSNPDDEVVFEGAKAVSVSELLDLTAKDLKR